MLAQRVVLDGGPAHTLDFSLSELNSDFDGPVPLAYLRVTSCLLVPEALNNHAAYPLKVQGKSVKLDFPVGPEDCCK